MSSPPMTPVGPENLKIYSGRLRLGRFRVPTINDAEECLRGSVGDFEKKLQQCNGKYFRLGDMKDEVVLELTEDINNAKSKISTKTKPNLLKKFIRSVPLPLFVPSMTKKVAALLILDIADRKMTVSMTNRSRYGKARMYAFQDMKNLRSLGDNEQLNSAWNPEFKLFDTESSHNPWSNLGYTEERFEVWWLKEKSETEGADCWADLRAFCRAVVFICDDICLLRTRKLPCMENIEALAVHSQEVAYHLVRQLCLYPEKAEGISTLFGYSVPLVFALSRVVDQAKEILKNDDELVELKSKRLLQRILELEPLLKETAQIIKDVGAKLKYSPYAVATKEDNNLSTYNPKPSIAQLFSTQTDELNEEGRSVLLETRLAKDEESLKIVTEQIQGEEMKSVARLIVDNYVEESDCNFDVADLRNLGLHEIPIDNKPVDILGSGSTSVVSVFTSPECKNTVYAIKHSKMTQSSGTWNRVLREASIWATLRHENVLPLLGYCIHPTELYPALVTRVCEDGSLKEFIKPALLNECKVEVPRVQKTGFLRDIAAGLAYLHSKKVSHGDLRAANILVERLPTASRRAVICDFGLSDFFEEVVKRLHRPTEEQKTGDKWLAPELMFPSSRTVARVSSKGDIYAFGCVILEVAFGRDPYHATPPEAICETKRRGDPPAFRAEMDPIYWPIAEKCWETLPDSRPDASYLETFFGRRFLIESGKM